MPMPEGAIPFFVGRAGGYSGGEEGARMTKWEYRFKPIDIGDLAMIEWGMKELGDGGWELVTIIPAAPNKWPQAVFKRPQGVLDSN